MNKERVELRIAAIAIVMAARTVLNDAEYVSAMGIATKLYPVSNVKAVGGDGPQLEWIIEKELFGNGYESVLASMNVEKERTIIIGYHAPNRLKTLYFDSIKKEEWSLKGFNDFCDSIMGTVTIA